MKFIKKVIWWWITLCRACSPLFDIFIIKYLAKRRGNIIIEKIPMSIKEYCNIRGECYKVIEDAQARLVYEPPYFDGSSGGEHWFRAPEMYVAELKNVVVHGGTGLMLTEKNALTDVCNNDVENRVKYTSGLIVRGSKEKFYLEVTKDVDEVEFAVNLCGLAAFNYYHLTFEILSRYAYVAGYLVKNDITILLDEDARKYIQCQELIDMIIGDVSIRFLNEGKRICCKKVIYPSMNTWMPMNVRRKYDFRLSDNLIAESAIKNIRQATEKYRKEKRERKLFVSRKNMAFSRIKNEVEVASLFEQAGYEIVCTEELSLIEQIEIFSSASSIVSASGAALTNIVYCNPGTVFGCIIPKKYNFCIYSSIAYMVGCRILFFDAEVVKTGPAISAEQYKVDLKDCRKYINRLDDLMNKNCDIE